MSEPINRTTPEVDEADEENFQHDKLRAVRLVSWDLKMVWYHTGNHPGAYNVPGGRELILNFPRMAVNTFFNQFPV